LELGNILSHEDYISLSIKSALEGVKAGHGGPFGACVVKDGQVLSVAHNTVISSNDPTSHAEVNAIRIASKAIGNYNLSGCILYTTCSPCPMCLSAAYWARVDRIIAGVNNEVASEYGFDDTLIFDEVRMGANSRKVPCEVGFCSNEVREVFKTWQSKGGTIY
jgi:guanine deaminase